MNNYPLNRKWFRTNWFRTSFLVTLLFLLILVLPQQGNAQYGSCSEYGPFAYEDYSGYCRCSSGYVFGENVVGQTYCVSGNQVCWDKYGYNSSYASLSSSCECSYGYVFGKDSIGRTQCVSPDSMCRDQLGYSARYNSLSDKCECGYGEVIDGGRCTDGDLVCHADHGYNSSYDDSSNKCHCDSGYTFDGDYQCVKKQNNVYFTLRELDADEKQAIIRSEYDYSYYLINYGIGCYAFSLKRYVGGQIVVNLGTDYSLDAWDKVVLQDDNEVCDITRVQRADSDTTLKEELDYGSLYIPAQPTLQSQVIPSAPTVTPISKVEKKSEVKKAGVEVVATSSEIQSTSTPEVRKPFWLKRFWNFLRGKSNE